MLPMFKKSHINTRAIEEYISQGIVRGYSENANKRNALKQASMLYKMVDGELYRHGSEREYSKFGLRIVVHDDEPQKKLDIISKYHIDDMGNHYGMNTTVKNVNKVYYWHGQSSHVKMFLKKCDHCKDRSKFSMEEWLEEEKNNLSKRRMNHLASMSTEIKNEIKNLGRIKKATPPETFFIVNAHRKVDLDNLKEDAEMLIDSNNIEYVVETLGNCEDSQELKEVCHVLNVPDIIPLPERFRSREIENFLKYGSFPADFTSNQKSGLKGPAVQYMIIDNELYHNSSKKATTPGPKLVIHDDNPALKVKIMVESHLDDDGNHLGLNRSMQKVNEKYFWLGLSVDIRKFMLKCKICSQNRGKRLDEDTSRFSEEVKKLKEKSAFQEGGTSADEVITCTVNSDGTVNEVNEDENYDQIYRLVGSDENDVTEITVKVVNGEVVQEAVDQSPQIIELEDKQLVALEEVTDGTVKELQPMDAIEQKDGKNTSNMEMVPAYYKDRTDAITEKIIEENSDPNPPMIIAGTVVPPSEEAVDPAEKTDDAAADCNDDSQKTTENEVSVETAIKMLVENEMTEETETQTELNEAVVNTEREPEQSLNTSQPSKLVSFYEDCIYVPKSKKTRAIEKYMENRTITMGYTTAKLNELAESFMSEDGVLFRRASRYKGKQIVIHDDQPEVKLKVLNEFHLKPNGDHCSEMVTFTNVQYKFYWEELRWDVNRFYNKCSVCVQDGVEIKTNKRVLTVKELKKKEMEQRKRVSEQGLTAKRNSKFRRDHKNTLATFRNWEKYGKDTVDNNGHEGDSVVKVAHDQWVEEEVIGAADTYMNGEGTTEDEESDIDINLDEGSDEEASGEEMTNLTVYGTREQEQKIRELFQMHGWVYQLDSMTHCTGEEQELGTKDLYEMVMITTAEQDQAIQELFKSLKESMEADEVETEEIERERKEDESKTETITELPKQSAEQKKTPSRKQIVENDELKETKKGTKRGAEELKESSTENRRPRREIKKPRRFSPDRMDEEQRNMSPKKTPKATPGTSKEPKAKQPQKAAEQNVSKVSHPTQRVKRQTNTDSEAVSRSTGKSTSKKSKPDGTSVEDTVTPVRATRSGKVSIQESDIKSIKSKQVEIQPVVDISKPISKGKDSGDVKTTHKKVKESQREKVVTEKVIPEETINKDKNEENTLDEIVNDSIDFDEIYEEGDDGYDDDAEDDFDDNLDKSVMDSALEVLKTDIEFQMEVVLIDGLYMCSLCDAEFENEDSCRVHGLQNKCYVNCKICGRSFRKNEKVELQKHNSMHDNTEKFPCSNCHRVFTTSQALQIHSRFHTGKKDETCRQCDEKFYTSFQLASHMYREHAESNLFNCDICKAKFVNMNFMKCEVLFDGIMSYFKCVMCDK